MPEYNGGTDNGKFSTPKCIECATNDFLIEFHCSAFTRNLGLKNHFLEQFNSQGRLIDQLVDAIGYHYNLSLNCIRWLWWFLCWYHRDEFAYQIAKCFAQMFSIKFNLFLGKGLFGCFDLADHRLFDIQLLRNSRLSR